jgi:CheY-like chemotaxis protein
MTGTGLSTALRVLLVDDSLAIVKMTSLMLRKLGHQITTAENGAVAVRAVKSLWREKRQSFDVILMDLQMPVMDGWEATKCIRHFEEQTRCDCECSKYDDDNENKNKCNFTENNSVIDDTDDDGNCTERRRPMALPRQHIVCVSANSDSWTEVAAVESGCDAFMHKPFSIDSFLVSIGRSPSLL